MGQAGNGTARGVGRVGITFELFLPENSTRVSDIQHGQIQAVVGIAFVGDDELRGGAADGGRGKVFNRTDCDLRFKNHNQQCLLVHTRAKDAVFLTLLINTAEIFLVDKVGDGLIREICAGGKRGNRGQVEFFRLAFMRDEKAAVVNEEGGARAGCFQKLQQRLVELADVFLEELWKRSHVMRIAARFG